MFVVVCSNESSFYIDENFCIKMLQIEIYILFFVSSFLLAHSDNLDDVSRVFLSNLSLTFNYGKTDSFNLNYKENEMKIFTNFKIMNEN